MRRGRLPLTALRAFEAAGRVENITLAAFELCVSQAAVSRQIKELEAQLGTKLFERIHRGVRLTSQGHQLLAALTLAFDGIDEALGEIDTKDIETITISSEPSFAACWLAPKLSELQGIVPNVDVVLSSEPHVVEFGNDDTTLAIRYAKERSSWPRTEVRKLCETRLSAYISPKLAKTADITSPAGFLTLPLFHEDNRDDWFNWFVAAGFNSPEIERGTVFNDSGVMLQAALSGQGVLLADDLLGRSAVANGDLICPFDISITGGSYWLACRKFDRLSESALSCADWLTKTLEGDAQNVS